jgi:hypothetical protein
MPEPKRLPIMLPGLIILDAIGLLLFIALVLRHVVLVYPWGLVVCLVLFAVNVLFVRRRFRFQHSQPSAPVPKLLWAAAAIFTPAGVASVVVWFIRQDLPSAMGGVAALLLVGYIWFLVYRLRHSTGHMMQ